MARSEKEKAKESKAPLTFANNYNYKSGFIIGKFRTYLYDTEEKFKLDHAGKHELLRGHMNDHADLFTNFSKTVMATYPTSEKLKAELNRIGTSVSDAHKKMFSGDKCWFRITFGEEKYVKGIAK